MTNVIIWSFDRPLCFTLLWGIFLLISSHLLQASPLDEKSLSSKPIYEVAVLGASTTGPMIEGVVGSIQKGIRQRFHAHHASQKQGFLGPQAIAEPLSLKNQPGVFPAPLMGSASLTFSFACQGEACPVTPLIVRPDGTIFYGLSMTSSNSPQTLVVASPAQTGIYTLFVLSHQKKGEGTEVSVEATISTQLQQRKTFQLKSFDHNEHSAENFSAEFIYTPSN